MIMKNREDTLFVTASTSSNKEDFDQIFTAEDVKFELAFTLIKDTGAGKVNYLSDDDIRGYLNVTMFQFQ